MTASLCHRNTAKGNKKDTRSNALMSNWSITYSLPKYDENVVPKKTTPKC